MLGDSVNCPLQIEKTACEALGDLYRGRRVTPASGSCAKAGVEFGDRVTRGRNRTTEGVLATMKLLLDAGANINARMVTEPGRNPAEGASQASQLAVAQRRPGQVPTAGAVPHQTALHGAAQRGFTEFVKFLAEHGADLETKDGSGRTALDLAKSVGYWSIFISFLRVERRNSALVARGSRLSGT